MKTLVVTAAVIERGGRYLVTRRGPDVHLAGCWEFPGGKCAAGEQLADCMKRELLEELDVTAIVGEQVLATTHVYGDRTVELHFFRCDVRGNPHPQQGQDMRWASAAELRELEFPPADEELIRLLAG